jgi:hypothetical protein
MISTLSTIKSHPNNTKNDKMFLKFFLKKKMLVKKDKMRTNNNKDVVKAH